MIIFYVMNFFAIFNPGFLQNKDFHSSYNIYVGICQIWSKSHTLFESYGEPNRQAQTKRKIRSHIFSTHTQWCHMTSKLVKLAQNPAYNSLTSYVMSEI